MLQNGSPPMIRLRGVAVHNLKSVDLDLPQRKWIAFCGVSGSGKTSLALDTLYAEGQRRYVESFSTYTRQFLEQLDKPAADRIEGIPPSIAVTRKNVSRSSRATVGSATQINEHLQLLFARIGQVICYSCGRRVQRDSTESASDELMRLPTSTRLMVGFTSARGKERGADEWLHDLISLGYRRGMVDGAPADIDAALAQRLGGVQELDVVVDRLTVQPEAALRLRDSLETAFEAGRGAAVVWIQAEKAPGHVELVPAASPPPGAAHGLPHLCSVATGDRARLVPPLQGEGTGAEYIRYVRKSFSRRLRCEHCGIQYPDIETQLLNYNSPVGACPACEGFGNIVEVDLARVVPDPTKSIREGAIAPWNTPAYEHELQELIALAPRYKIPLDVPFAELTAEQVALIRDGVPERKFGGLVGFFNWLERRKYKMHIRVFLSRWRSYYPCTACAGLRLKPEALAVRIDEKNIAEVSMMPVGEALPWLRSLPLDDWQRQVGRLLIDQVTSRLNYLERVGVGHLTIDRPLRTLSGGEAQRVALTAALGSTLTGMLYVLDEPSAGLHPADLPRLVNAVAGLRDRGNTVAVVEHEPTLIESADHVVELGPGAGEFGGKVIFQGAPAAMIESPESRTGD